MAARYQIFLKDTSGDVVAVLDDWRSLSFTKKVNDIGTFSLELNPDDPRVAFFELDTIVEIYRRNQQFSIDWYKEFEGFHRTFRRSTDPSGYSTYVSEGISFNDLLARRIIAWYVGEPETYKADVAETVMKEYVNENAGPGALVGSGRLVGGVTSGLSIQADGATGNAWQGDRAYKNLLDVLKEISLAGDVDFEVIGTGPAGGIQTFEFQTFEDYRGDDRSTTGLDTATGLNGAGNAPVVFSLSFGNMTNPSLVKDRVSEATSILMMGQGTTTGRVNVEVVDGAAEVESPWNHREYMRNASQETLVASLQAVGVAELEDRKAVYELGFDVLQVEAGAYGRDYFLGDLVTVQYAGIEVNLQVVGVSINVSESGEDIALNFSEVS